MRKQTHIHRYEKITLGKNGYTVFRCNFPNCSHYIRKELAKNRISICNRCGEPMVLDARAMNLMKPHCTSCVQRKDKDKLEELKELFG